MNLLAVISVHRLPDNIEIKLLELTKVLPRCAPRFDPVIVAYPIEEAHGDSAVASDVQQGGSPVERLHAGLPGGVYEGCPPSSGLASIEHLLVEAAEQLPLGQDA